jgi:hypothetical protein
MPLENKSPYRHVSGQTITACWTPCHVGSFLMRLVCRVSIPGAEESGAGIQNEGKTALGGGGTISILRWCYFRPRRSKSAFLAGSGHRQETQDLHL